MGYHVIMLVVLVALAIHDPGLRHARDLDSADVFAHLMYPPFVPGLVVCEGMHQHCASLIVARSSSWRSWAGSPGT